MQPITSVLLGKLLRVETSWECSMQADRQIRTRPQSDTSREKIQSKRALRCPVDAWDVTQGKTHLQHWASGSTTARQDQQPANYWHQGRLRNGKRKTTSRHNILSGDMQSQHKGLYLLKIKRDVKHSFTFDLILSLSLHSPAYQPCTHPLCALTQKNYKTIPAENR